MNRNPNHYFGENPAPQPENAPRTRQLDWECNLPEDWCQTTETYKFSPTYNCFNLVNATLTLEVSDSEEEEKVKFIIEFKNIQSTQPVTRYVTVQLDICGLDEFLKSASGSTTNTAYHYLRNHTSPLLGVSDLTGELEIENLELMSSKFLTIGPLSTSNFKGISKIKIIGYAYVFPAEYRKPSLPSISIKDKLSTFISGLQNEAQVVKKLFGEAYASEVYYDFYIETSSTSVGFHKELLRLRGGPILRAALNSNMKESLANKILIHNYDEVIIQGFKKYVYEGAVDWVQLSPQNAFEFGSQYQLNDVKELAELELCTKLNKTNVKEYCGIVKMFETKHLKPEVLRFLKGNSNLEQFASLCIDNLDLNLILPTV